jgi:hypothetical protein
VSKTHEVKDASARRASRRTTASSETLWKLPENKEPKDKRENSTLMAGDKVFVPDLREKKVSSPSRSVIASRKGAECGALQDDDRR